MSHSQKVAENLKCGDFPKSGVLGSCTNEGLLEARGRNQHGGREVTQGSDGKNEAVWEACGVR